MKMLLFMLLTLANSATPAFSASGLPLPVAQPFGENVVLNSYDTNTSAKVKMSEGDKSTQGLLNLLERDMQKRSDTDGSDFMFLMLALDSLGIRGADIAKLSLSSDPNSIVNLELGIIDFIVSNEPPYFRNGTAARLERQLRAEYQVASGPVEEVFSAQPSPRGPFACVKSLISSLFRK